MHADPAPPGDFSLYSQAVKGITIFSGALSFAPQPFDNLSAFGSFKIFPVHHFAMDQSSGAESPNNAERANEPRQDASGNGEKMQGKPWQFWVCWLAELATPIASNLSFDN